MRISDWSSDVCSSDLSRRRDARRGNLDRDGPFSNVNLRHHRGLTARLCFVGASRMPRKCIAGGHEGWSNRQRAGRSEEHTSELQSLMRISYAVFCLKKKKK